MADKRDYNKSVAALWKTKNGNFLSMEIDARTLEQIRGLADGAEIGGKLIFKLLSEETREKFKGGTDKAPHAFLEYITAANVAEFKANNPRKRENESSGL